jgi:predicted nuclease of predicted toxin-antitoxin system
MPWNKLGRPDDAEIKSIIREKRGKPKFLVDESLGAEVTELLRKSGWNAIDVFEIGINGQPDENVFAAARSRDRILLTHDRDFLSNRHFPPQLNPGLVVLPGGNGDRRALVNALDELLTIIGATRELWRATKIEISNHSEWTVLTFNRDDGIVHKSRFRFLESGGGEYWSDSDGRVGQAW